MQEEKELIIALKLGSQTAFTALYHLYSGRLLGKLIRFTKSETEAVEILQNTFIKVWNHRESIDPERSFRSYLFRISENLVYDFYRKAARERNMRKSLSQLHSGNYEGLEEELFKKENEAAIQDIVNRLSPQRRHVFKLVKFEDKTYHEVAELLNISPATISDHIVKATKFIRKHLAMHLYILVFLFLHD